MDSGMREACTFELSRNEVHIWTLRTSDLKAAAPIFERVLVTDEMERAQRFRFSHLRESFVIARGALRYLLGRYLDVPPSRITFVYGSKGKPALASVDNVQFNMTHSGTLAAVAITADCQIGIDVEQIRQLSDMEQIAERFFCPEETKEIMSVPPCERAHTFFRCWTLKEAYVKAVGDGLSVPLNGFQVTLQPDRPKRLVHVGNDIAAAESWTLHELCLAPDHAAALAYRDRERSVSVFRILDLAEFAGEALLRP
jgi:4'-phosphopantetheinyl transferase